MKQDHQDKIEEAAVATAKGSIGAVSVGLALAYPQYAAIALIAPYLPEWFAVTLPNRRLDRLEKMLLHLQQKTGNQSLVFLNEKLKDQEFENLFERSCKQSAEALRDLRLESIAGVLASECTNEQTNSLRADACLSTIESLDDFQLYLLVEIGAFSDHRFADPGVTVYDAASVYMIADLSHQWFSGCNYDPKTNSRDQEKDKEAGMSSIRKMHSAGLLYELRDEDNSSKWRLSLYGESVMLYIRKR